MRWNKYWNIKLNSIYWILPWAVKLGENTWRKKTSCLMGKLCFIIICIQSFLNSLQAPKQFKKKFAGLCINNFPRKILKLNIFIPQFWWNSVNSNTHRKWVFALYWPLLHIAGKFRGLVFSIGWFMWEWWFLP